MSDTYASCVARLYPSRVPNGVTFMPSTANSDADCIQCAYEDALAGLFKHLFENLTGRPDGPSDQIYVAKFTAGFNAAKHAKGLALEVVGSSPPMSFSAALKKQNVAKRKTR